MNHLQKSIHDYDEVYVVVSEWGRRICVEVSLDDESILIGPLEEVLVLSDAPQLHSQIWPK